MNISFKLISVQRLTLLFIWILFSISHLSCGSRPSKENIGKVEYQGTTNHFVLRTYLITSRKKLKSLPTFYSEGITSSFMDSWTLYFYKEPVIWKEKQNDQEIYRLTDDGMMIPFYRVPKVVRIIKSSKGINIIAKIRWKRFVIEMRRKVQKEEWKKLKRLIKKARFWTLKTYIDRYGHDGWYIRIEGVKKGKYHVISRWVPEGPVGDLYDYMTGLANFPGLR